MFKVSRKRCDECLFSASKIVDDDRKAEILATLTRRGEEGHFICHKFTLAELADKLTPDEANVCCRGFWDTFPENSAAMQIAQRLGFVEFVDFPEAGDVQNL